MRRRRNPRRACDETGQEIAPPTVGSCRAQGETTVSVWCHDCRHSVIISTDRFPPGLPIPDIALRLRCSACQGRRIGVMKGMQAHYASAHGETGWRMHPARPLPESYRVVGRDVPWPDGLETTKPAAG